MARKRPRRLVVPEASGNMEQFKAEVMKNEGYPVNEARPNLVKYEVARSLGVPLKQGNNGKLTTEEAGKVGGRIGGTMVKELIRMAQEQLARNKHNR